MLWELGVLASVRSLNSKIQNIGLWRSTHRGMRDCCVLVFTEIWFNSNILETGIEFDWLTLHRADRVAASSGKHWERGLVVYTNDSWLRSGLLRETHTNSFFLAAGDDRNDLTRGLPAFERQQI